LPGSGADLSQLPPELLAALSAAAAGGGGMPGLDPNMGTPSNGSSRGNNNKGTPSSSSSSRHQGKSIAEGSSGHRKSSKPQHFVDDEDDVYQGLDLSRKSESGRKGRKD